MPPATGGVGRARSVGPHPGKLSSAAFTRWLLIGFCAVAAVNLLLAALASGFDWHRLHGPAAALAGLALVVASAAHGNARVRQVRAWIAIGFGAWTASQLVTALQVHVAGIPPADMSVALLGGVLVAAIGGYWAALHGKVSLREEVAVYLDAAIVAAAVTALLLALFRGGPAGATDLLSPTMIHATLFLAILGATLILDLAVLAELKLTGAYGLLIGVACIALGFVGRSAIPTQGVAWAMPMVVSLGVLVVALGTATWSDRRDDNPAYARVAARLRGWLPLAAAADHADPPLGPRRGSWRPQPAGHRPGNRLRARRNGRAPEPPAHRAWRAARADAGTQLAARAPAGKPAAAAGDHRTPARAPRTHRGLRGRGRHAGGGGAARHLVDLPGGPW